MKKIILSTIIALAALTVYLSLPEAKIARAIDYQAYLQPGPIEQERLQNAAQIDFWEDKLTSHPDNFVYQKKLAQAYASRFKRTGDIRFLHQSDSLLALVNARIPGQVGVLQSLAANAITRHAFREAEAYLREARQTGEQEFTSSLLLVDVLLERGNRIGARRLLQDMASPGHFDYLIREVKWYDQSDELGKAIRGMEKALATAKASGSPALTNWALSNLADMYGHDGRVEKAYETYLEALRNDPADLHSLKGIAWIAFSHDQDQVEARRILAFLKSVHPVPDYDLFLAEIAAFEQDPAAEAAYQEQFLREASRPAYGNMYKSYICLLRSGSGATGEAVAIARAEIQERPHPMSYHLLAWSSFQSGNPEAAQAILDDHVIGQTGEPDALYHAGIILKENGREQEAVKLLRAALDASFELGPVTTAEIRNHLAQL